MGLGDELNDISGTAEIKSVDQLANPVPEMGQPPVVVEEKPLTPEQIAEAQAKEALKQQEREAMENPDYNDEGKDPNVKLSGKGRALNAGPLIIGRLKLQLPSIAQQKEGFYTPHAGELVSQYRQYKFLEKLGTKDNQVIKIQ